LFSVNLLVGRFSKKGRPPLSILQSLVEWSKGLPAWQSDALARLLTQPSLDEDDLDDLCALLKAEHGIPDEKERTANKLEAAHVPAPAGSETAVVLLAIRDLCDVNAIAPGTRLVLGTSGLTVVYGHNGVGKSGYSRVLKRACRARDQSEPIHPNASQAQTTAAHPSAVFEIEVDGTPQTQTWTMGSTAPPELSALSVFDARCAREYLDQEDDFSFVPQGLDALRGLARACQDIKSKLTDELRLCSVDRQVFDPLRGDTEVGRLVGSLSAGTPISEVERLAALSDQEREEHGRLDQSLKQDNPTDKARQLSLTARRARDLSARCTEKASFVAPSCVARLRRLVDERDAARKAAAIAHAEFHNAESLLPGTGTTPWRSLFESARQFAATSHPEADFPKLGADEACPLCQEPLSESGAARMARFDAFIQAEAEKALDTASRAFDEAFAELCGQTMTLGLDESTYKEIAAIDEQLAIDCRTYETAIENRREAIKTAVADGQWDGLDIALETPSDRLEALSAKLGREAETMEQAADETKRAAMRSALDELNARIKLSEIKDALIRAVKKLELAAKLNRCVEATGTTGISRKASELAQEAVSNELAEALNREFRALGVGQLQVALKSRSERGQPLHKLVLDHPQTHGPAAILSEGEQRAIALASFFAEVGLTSGKGGVIFDDPVSSLDHRRRERVVHRLVDEARRRQVIVFTHDIYFLCLLVEAGQRIGIELTTRALVRQPEGFGVAVDELPFEGLNTKKRVGFLKDHQIGVAKLERANDEEAHRKATVEAYRLLRDAWERGVEEVLFQGVVQRFQKGIGTQKLDRVTVEDDDYKAIEAGMSKCSNYSHDKAAAGGVAVPDAAELLADIQALEDWRVTVDSRSKATQKRRRA
jgi:energy-coupling factor transporter ATP-binding protein EcfA2